MRTVTDDQGREWSAKRVGRTSGIHAGTRSKSPSVESSDIVRFCCEGDVTVPDREITAKAGLLEQLSEDELRALLKAATPV